MRNYTEEQVWAEFMKGYDCGQVIVRHYAEALGLDLETATRIASPLGAGMFRGDTCGAVAGGYLVLGLKFGPKNGEEAEKKPALIGRLREFDEKFKAKERSLVCEDILGGNILTDEQRLQEENAMQKKCPSAVIHTIDVLNEMGV